MGLSDILTQCLEYKGKYLFVREQLPSKAYSKLKGLLERLGGKWSKNHQGFAFTRDPKLVIERVLACGARNINKFHLYPSTEAVFEHMVSWTALNYLGASGKRIKVLEPSIGTGFLANSLLAYGEKENRSFDIQGYDIDPINVVCCEEQGYQVEQKDFLTVEPSKKFDLVMMNPPFNRNEFIKHIRHALKFLTPNGVLISVIPVGWLEDINSSDREWLLERICCDSNDSLVKGDFLPPGTFEGTSVETTIIQLNSDIAHDKLITSDFFIESRVTTFNTILSNDVECLALIEAPNIERISPIDVVDKVLRADEEHSLPRSLKDRFVKEVGYYFDQPGLITTLPSMQDLLFREAA